MINVGFQTSHVTNDDASQLLAKNFEALAITNQADIQDVSEYAQEIAMNMVESEIRFRPKADYLQSQPEINQKMREVLIDWLMAAQTKFKLKDETFFLAVGMIDRFLSLERITRKELQLVGVASLMIAGKYEEIYPPEGKNYVYVCDGAFTKRQIANMEMKILKKLDFDVTAVTSFRLAERILKVCSMEVHSMHLTVYLLYLSLQSYTMVQYLPSVLATSATYASQKILKKENAERVCFVLARSEDDIRQCVKDILRLFQLAKRSSLHAINTRFSRREFSNVAQIKIL